VVSAGYLLLVNLRFAPLAFVAVGMVFARPLAGAHTWLQSIVGLLLSVAFLLGVVQFRALQNCEKSTDRTNFVPRPVVEGVIERVAHQSRVHAEVDEFSNPARLSFGKAFFIVAETETLAPFEHLSFEFLEEFDVFAPAERGRLEHG
jgi:hypothetical protein